MTGVRIRRVGLTVLQWLISAAIVYAAWELFITPNLPGGFSASAGEVVRQLRTWLTNGTAWDMTERTLSEALAGLAVGSAAGILLAMAIGLSPPIVGRFFEPFVSALYAMPKFVLVPILFVWIGAGFTPRVIIVTISTLPILTIYTLTGIRTVDPDRAWMLRLYGANRRQVGAKLLLPHTIRHIVTGLTLALPHAMFIAIGAEILFGDTNGIGGVLNTEAQLFNPQAVFASLTIATVLSVVLIGAVRLISTRLLGVDIRRSAV